MYACMYRIGSRYALYRYVVMCVMYIWTYVVMCVMYIWSHASYVFMHAHLCIRYVCVHPCTLYLTLQFKVRMCMHECKRKDNNIRYIMHAYKHKDKSKLYIYIYIHICIQTKRQIWTTYICMHTNTKTKKRYIRPYNPRQNMYTYNHKHKHKHTNKQKTRRNKQKNKHTRLAGTGLYELWRTGKYQNYAPSLLVDLVAHILALVPPWTRIYRIQRSDCVRI